MFNTCSFEIVRAFCACRCWTYFITWFH